MIDLDSEFPIINEIARQLRQCYVCTARSTGCGEYLDPRYASRYIQPCASSCILFRNPNDHHRERLLIDICFVENIFFLTLF